MGRSGRGLVASISTSCADIIASVKELLGLCAFGATIVTRQFTIFSKRPCVYERRASSACAGGTVAIEVYGGQLVEIRQQRVPKRQLLCTEASSVGDVRRKAFACLSLQAIES